MYGPVLVSLLLSVLSPVSVLLLRVLGLLFLVGVWVLGWAFRELLREQQLEQLEWQEQEQRLELELVVWVAE